MCRKGAATSAIRINEPDSCRSAKSLIAVVPSGGPGASKRAANRLNERPVSRSGLVGMNGRDWVEAAGMSSVCNAVS